MDTFKQFFGVPAQDIKPHCIICPIDHSGFFSSLGHASRAKGTFYRTFTTRHATLITTQFNFAVGDCILSLKNTPCRNIYLFGSCGSTGDAPVGTPVLLRKSFNLESFTGMLNRAEPDVCYPDESLYSEIRSFGIMPSLTTLDGAAVSSLVLEEDYLAWFLQHAVSCVDMESSIIFSAAEHIGRKAVALLYVTDVLAKKPFYAPLPAEDRTALRRAQKDLAEFLCRFIIHAGN